MLYMLTFIFFRFGLSSQLQLVLYPQFIHPLKHFVLTASILMIVALTFERYCAVYYPQDYREVRIFQKKAVVSLKVHISM